MKLNETKGNMYEFITHTWNPIKGQCYHDCSYCYMKVMPYPQGQMRLDKSELTGKFDPNHFIFIGSSTDFCANNVPSEWIEKVFDFCYEGTKGGLFEEDFNDRTHFLLQTKNPERLLEFINHPLLDPNRNQAVVCTALETNRFLPEIMHNSPTPESRAIAMSKIAEKGIKTFVTVEPIMDFESKEFVRLIKLCKPIQVNIGMNSVRSFHVPEPSKELIIELIKELIKFTKVHLKENTGNLQVTLRTNGIHLN